MKLLDFINTEPIKTIITGGISAMIGAIASNAFYSIRIRKDIKKLGNDEVAKSIQKSLDVFRELELTLKSYEIYDLDNSLRKNAGEMNVFSGVNNYLTIFRNKENLFEFQNRITECRSKYEANLTCKLALNLVFIEKYVYQFGLLLMSSGIQCNIEDWGIVMSSDLIKWQKKVDKLVVREINRHRYRLESHETSKWQRLRKIEVDKQYKQTILNQMDLDLHDNFEHNRMAPVWNFLLYRQEQLKWSQSKKQEDAQ